MDNSKMYILFIKGYGIVSKGILYFEKIWDIRSKYTHVGLVVHKNIFDKKISNMLCLKEEFYILESTLSGEWNDSIKNSCNKVTLGPQFRSFNEFVDTYSKYNNSKAKLVELPSVLNLDLNNYLGKLYDYNLLNLMTIHIPYIVYNNNKYFCSDFIVCLLKDNNMIDNSINSKKISPNSLYKLLKKHKLVTNEIIVFLN